MRGRLAREWPPILPRRGMQSIGGGRTNNQQRQSQEPSQPQHSQTNKLYCQSSSCVRAPAAGAFCAHPSTQRRDRPSPSIARSRAHGCAFRATLLRKETVSGEPTAVVRLMRTSGDGGCLPAVYCVEIARELADPGRKAALCRLMAQSGHSRRRERCPLL